MEGVGEFDSIYANEIMASILIFRMCCKPTDSHEFTWWQRIAAAALTADVIFSIRLKRCDRDEYRDEYMNVARNAGVCFRRNAMKGKDFR